MAGATHLGTIVINIILAAAPLTPASFGTVMLLVDGATSSLNGERVVTYTSADAAQADQTAGYITASVLKAVQTAFSQSPAPEKFKLGRVDTAGGEGYDDGYAAVKAADNDFYGVCIEPRTDAAILETSASIETENKLFVFQSADADWLTTGGVPTALLALDERENTAGIWHDTATEWADVAWSVGRLAFNVDETSTTWNATLKNVLPYASGITEGQLGFAHTNHINTALKFHSTSVWVDAGVNMTGRGVYETVTTHWFEARLSERIQTLKANSAARGEKIPLNEIGQVMCLAELSAQWDIAVAAGHIEDDNQLFTLGSINESTREIGIIAEGKINKDTRKFRFNIYFS